MQDDILAPHMPTCPLMAIAWASAVQWAISEPDMLKQFQHDTGIKWVAPRNGIERMIDESTGHGRDVVVKFLAWFNETQWGDLNLVAGESTGEEEECPTTT